MAFLWRASLSFRSAWEQNNEKKRSTKKYAYFRAVRYGACQVRGWVDIFFGSLQNIEVYPLSNNKDAGGRREMEIRQRKDMNRGRQRRYTLLVSLERAIVVGWGSACSLWPPSRFRPKLTHGLSLSSQINGVQRGSLWLVPNHSLQHTVCTSCCW